MGGPYSDACRVWQSGSARLFHNLLARPKQELFTCVRAVPWGLLRTIWISHQSRELIIRRTLPKSTASIEISQPVFFHKPVKTYTTLVPKLGKHTLFADSGRKKTPLFQPKSLILRSNKTPIFKANRDYIFIIQEKVPLFGKARLITSNILLINQYIVFFTTSNLEWVFEYSSQV